MATLGELVPGPDTLVTSAKVAAPLTPATNSVTQVDDAGQIAVPQTLATEDANRGGSTPLDAVEFGAEPTYDPNAKLHMPTLEQLGIQHQTTTTDPFAGMPTDTGAASGWRAQVVAMAHKMLGTPYVWGGESYSGVDCSGLVQLLYNKLGFNLPRVSSDQARSGKVVSFKDLQPGDLVAIDNNPRLPGADHIGIYVGKGMVIQAPHPGGVVELTSINDGFAGGFGISLSHK